MSFRVIRGAKPRETTPRQRFDWDEYLRRNGRAAPQRPECEPVVIPILEGWVRVLERQAAGSAPWRQIGRE